MEQEPVEPPEKWAQPFIDWMAERLRRAGYRGVEGPLAPVYAAIAAGHLTGHEYFYEYAVDAYYEVLDELEAREPLSSPRWAPHAWWLEDEVEALAEFEQRLADSETVFCAEPVLAAALLGAGLGAAPAPAWRRAGYTGRPGGYLLLARRRNKRCKILVPGSVFALALAGLSARSISPGGAAALVVPDPAILRKTVYDARVPYAEVSEFLRGLVEEAARRAAGATREEACREKGLMMILYEFKGLLEARFEYIC